MHPIKEIDEATAAFPTDVVTTLMPKYDEIPEDFKEMWNPYNKLVNRWFFQGLENSNFTPKESVDTDKALRHISAIMRSFQPKHEHKTAACAFLLAEWFEKIEADNISDIKF